jgi:PIN domain nuclease of toxin-antitoxin system
MRLLLDTHALLWWHEGASELSGAATAALSDPTNTVYFSAVNVWEIQIKRHLGKLHLSTPLPQLVDRQHRVNGFGVLAVRVEHIYRLDTLPLHHRDPFDRLLVAQALEEDLTLLTRDAVVASYDVPVHW